MKRPWLIKTGGELLADPSSRRRILDDLARLHRARPVVFVHGGGPQIEQALIARNVAAPKVHGRRVTTPEAMAVVEEVLSGPVNKSLAAELNARGAKAVGLSCRDAGLIQGEPLPELGRAARPKRVDPALLQALLKGGFLPVVSPVASDRGGAAVNINADDAASALAAALKVENLIFLTDSAGVFDANRETIPALSRKRIQELIAAGVIQGGMIPKVQSALAALQKGVGEVDIANGHQGVRLESATRILKK